MDDKAQATAGTSNDSSVPQLDPQGLTVPLLVNDDNPFSLPDDIPSTPSNKLDDTHPATDTDIDIDEEYDEGIAGAAEAAEGMTEDPSRQ